MIEDERERDRFMRCAHAASTGDLGTVMETMKRSYSTHIYANAAARGHTDILEWLVNNAHEADEDACRHAVVWGHLDVAEWLLSLGMSIDARATFNDCVSRARVPSLIWLSRRYPHCVQYTPTWPQELVVWTAQTTGWFAPGRCLVWGCRSDVRQEGLCPSHAGHVYGVLCRDAGMCRDTAMVVVRYVVSVKRKRQWKRQ